MLAEYDRLRELFLKNEEDGHTRVNLFITLTTGLMGAFGVTKQLAPTGDSGLFFLPALFALLFLGIFFLRRIIRRNISTDDLKAQLDKIRSYFIQYDHTIRNYLTHTSTTQKNYLRERINSWDKWYTPGTGGYGQIIILLNTVIFAFILIIATSYVIMDGNFQNFIKIYIPFEEAPTLLLISCDTLFLILYYYFQHSYLHRIYKNHEITELRKKKILNSKSLDLSYPSEHELSFIIFSNKYDKIVNELNRQKKIKKFKLMDKGKTNLQDSYYDIFPGELLESKRFSLRIRKENGNYLLALKGPSKEDRHGTTSRIEIEGIWSMETIRMVLAEMSIVLQRELLIPHNVPSNLEGFLEKVKLTTDGLRFQKIQSRVTDRKNISVSKKGHTFANMYIDQVTYLEIQPVKYYNIEIELNKDFKSKSENDDIEIMLSFSEFKDNLLLLLYPNLREWKHSKLATGKGIKKLLENKEMVGLFDDQSYLTQFGFYKVDKFLKE